MNVYGCQVIYECVHKYCGTAKTSSAEFFGHYSPTLSNIPLLPTFNHITMTVLFSNEFIHHAKL